MSNFTSYSTFTPSADTEAASSGPTVRLTEGVTAITLSGNATSTETHEYTSISADDLSPFDDSDWRSTARDRIGFPTNNITTDSVVEISGMSAKVSDFIKAGILKESADGFTLAANEDPLSNTHEEASEEPPDFASMPEEIATAIDNATEPFNQATLDVGLAHAISAAVGDMSVENVITGMAQRSGLEPTDVAERVRFTISAYQAQADSYLTKNGLATEELQNFYSWARQNPNKAALTSALQQQAYGRDMSAWKPLIANFMRSVAPSPQALQAIGFEVDGNLVRIEGKWMDVKAAAKAGFI